MNLLIVTQKVDLRDDNIGAFHYWIKEFAARVQSVSVIANGVGNYALPPNTQVYSLGKERSAPRIIRWWRFLVIFSREYARHDAVFFHMMPEFVIAASPFLLSLRKPSALWYVHKSVTWKLKCAERIVRYIVTASSLSFRLPSKKVIYTGHAIDTDVFQLRASARANPGIHLLTVGRISPVKDIETMIRACALLKGAWNRAWSFTIVGGPAVSRDGAYLESLERLIKSRGLASHVHFAGPEPYFEIPETYHAHDMFLSMSTTGSLDKAVLEAMASGLTVITANEAFRDILPEKYFLTMRTPEALAERIRHLADDARPNYLLREAVMKNHSLRETISKIVSLLNA